MSDIARNQVETSGAKRSNPRTCVGCKKRDAKANLVKVVAVNGELIFDPAKSIPGRGAWIHPRVHCLELAQRRRAFGRAFRTTASVITWATVPTKVKSRVCSPSPCTGSGTPRSKTPAQES